MNRLAELVAENWEWLASVGGLTGILLLFGKNLAETILKWKEVFRARTTESGEAIAKSEGHDREGNSLLKRILQRGLLRVGYFHYEPLIQAPEGGGSGQPSGLYSMIAERAGAAAGVALEWKLLHISECVDAVTSGRVDVVACVFQTPIRYRFVDFAALLHLVVISGVHRSDDVRFRSAVDLRKQDVRIAIAKGEVGEELLVQLGVEIDLNRVIQIGTSDFSDTAALVANGIADVAVVDGVSARRYVAAHPEQRLAIAFESVPIAICPNGVMLPQGEPKLGAWIDRYFSAARQDPEVRRVEKELLQTWNGVIESLG